MLLFKGQHTDTRGHSSVCACVGVRAHVRVCARSRARACVRVRACVHGRADLHPSTLTFHRPNTHTHTHTQHTHPPNTKHTHRLPQTNGVCPTTTNNHHPHHPRQLATLPTCTYTRTRPHTDTHPPPATHHPPHTTAVLSYHRHLRRPATLCDLSSLTCWASPPPPSPVPRIKTHA